MYHIRRAEPGDVETINTIFAEAIMNAQWLAPEVKSNTDFTKVSEGETVVVCCDREGDVLGFVSVCKPDSFVHHLYVAEHCRGQGVGTALLDSLKTWVRLPWHLKCVARNRSALTFYLARGWIEESRAQGPDGPYVLFNRREA
jgi:GNAT superfamily N-acetyltransferase